MWNFTQRGTHKMEIITNRSQTLILTGPAGSQTLIINNTQWRDVGVYKCIASIDGTIIETETSLDVLSKPLILQLDCGATDSEMILINIFLQSP